MARIFLSYVRDDLVDVQRLVTILREYGIDVWFDRDQLRPGHRWRDEIRAGIAQGDFFIACFSKKYSERTRTYMNEELTLAIEELRQRPTDRAWFLPVLLSETEIPDRSIGAGETLRSLQWVELYNDWHAGVSRILSVVHPNSGKVHQLIQALDSVSARERIRSADSLRILGPLASQAVPRLVKLLSDENETVRAAGAQALGTIGVENEDVVAALLAIISEADVYYDSEHAASALANLGRLGVCALLDAKNSSGYGVGGKAVEHLITAGRRVVPHLIGLIESGDRRAETAEEVLSEISDHEALPILTSALRSSSLPVRRAAAAAIGEIFSYESPVPGHSEEKAAIEALIDSCKDRAVRPRAIRALGEAGPEAKEAAPILLEALRQHDPSAAEALGKVGVISGEVIAALIAAVDVEDTRANAIESLGLLGDAAMEAVPLLITALRDSAVRSISARAIGQIGPAAEQAIDSLILALDDSDEHVRWEAALALGRIGKRANAAVPKMIPILESADDYAFQWRVAEALGNIQDERAVEPLIRALSAHHVSVRSSAAQALGRIGRQSATTALLKQSRDDDFGVRWSVIEALGDLGTKGDREVFRRLVEILGSDDNVGARRQAAKSLMKIGDAAAISALNAALNDENELVREDAQAALDHFASRA